MQRQIQKGSLATLAMDKSQKSSNRLNADELRDCFTLKDERCTCDTRQKIGNWPEYGECETVSRHGCAFVDSWLSHLCNFHCVQMENQVWSPRVVRIPCCSRWQKRRTPTTLCFLSCISSKRTTKRRMVVQPEKGQRTDETTAIIAATKNSIHPRTLIVGLIIRMQGTEPRVATRNTNSNEAVCIVIKST